MVIVEDIINHYDMVIVRMFVFTKKTSLLQK